MRAGLFVAVAFAALLSVPAAAETGSFFQARIERLVATPTPIGPVLIASDAAAWELRIRDPTIVWIEAHANATSPFYLTVSCGVTVAALPSTHDGRICSRPGTWHVQVDPAAGVAVDITVTFRGHVGDLHGAPSAFTVAATRADRGCVVPGVCLP